jgi:catalase
LKVYENDTAITDVNNVTRNSIAVVVEGGTTPEIATAIRKTKSLGCGTYGTTAYAVIDEQGQYMTVKFSYVTSKAIKLKVTITPLSKYSSSSNDLIKTNLLAYINGHEIGETLYYGQLMAVAYQTQSQYFETFNISKIEISVDGGAYTTNTDVACTIFQAVAMALASDVEVILI